MKIKISFREKYRSRGNYNGTNNNNNKQLCCSW